MIECHQCGESIELEGKVMRKDTCPSCHSFLHCCMHCEFHDRSAHNQCREPAAEWVSNKEAANFCEYFQPGPGGDGTATRSDAGLDAFHRLFKK